MDYTSESRDQLSELPDSIILFILSFLPIRNLIWTTLLSKRWKDLWTSVPCLNFIGNTKDLPAFEILFYQSLHRLKGSKILKLKVDLQSDLLPCYDLDLFLYFAMAYQVEELSIIVYTCPSIMSWPFMKLPSLLGSNLETLENVRWNQLKYLTIDGVCLNEQVINLVVTFAPRLEFLSLRFIQGNKDLSIESTSLKTIKIERFVFGNLYVVSEGDDGVVIYDELRIRAPNLETLEILGPSFSRIFLDVSSLSNAILDFCGRCYYKSGRFSGCELSEVILRHVFESLQDVKNVTLSNWCVKVLGEMKKNGMFAPLLNAKSLKLYTSEVDEIVDILELFPKLKMLVLELKDLLDYEINQYIWRELFQHDAYVLEHDVPNIDMNEYFLEPTNLSKSYLLHLRTVTVTWIVNDVSIYPFIEFVLKHATALEKMVFQLTGIASLSTPDPLILAAQKLESMAKASPNVGVILCRG